MVRFHRVPNIDDREKFVAESSGSPHRFTIFNNSSVQTSIRDGTLESHVHFGEVGHSFMADFPPLVLFLTFYVNNQVSIMAMGKPCPVTTQEW